MSFDEVDTVTEPVIVGLALSLLKAAGTRVHAARKRIGLVVMRLPLLRVFGRARSVACDKTEVRVAPGRRLRVWRTVTEQVIIGILWETG